MPQKKTPSAGLVARQDRAGFGHLQGCWTMSRPAPGLQQRFPGRQGSPLHVRPHHRRLPRSDCDLIEGAISFRPSGWRQAVAADFLNANRCPPPIRLVAPGVPFRRPYQLVGRCGKTCSATKGCCCATCPWSAAAASIGPCIEYTYVSISLSLPDCCAKSSRRSVTDMGSPE